MKDTTNRVEISIKISTDFNASNQGQMTRLQIEQTGMYISALFWFIKNTVVGFDLLDIKTETKLFEFPDFRGNVELLAEIGEALADQLGVFTATLATLEEKEKEDEK